MPYVPSLFAPYKRRSLDPSVFDGRLAFVPEGPLLTCGVEEFLEAGSPQRKSYHEARGVHFLERPMPSPRNERNQLILTLGPGAFEVVEVAECLVHHRVDLIQYSSSRLAVRFSVATDLMLMMMNHRTESSALELSVAGKPLMKALPCRLTGCKHLDPFRPLILQQDCFDRTETVVGADPGVLTPSVQPQSSRDSRTTCHYFTHRMRKEA